MDPIAELDELLERDIPAAMARALNGQCRGLKSWSTLGGILNRAAELAYHAAGTAAVPAAIDAAHLQRQREFSTRTFGPGPRTAGVIDHIRKELREIEAAPTDLDEWADVLILAFDGAWRAGHEPQAIIDAVVAKQARNEARTWPDWRTMPADAAIEHDRTVVDDFTPEMEDAGWRETDEHYGRLLAAPSENCDGPELWPSVPYEHKPSVGEN